MNQAPFPDPRTVHETDRDTDRTTVRKMDRDTPQEAPPVLKALAGPAADPARAGAAALPDPNHAPTGFQGEAAPPAPKLRDPAKVRGLAARRRAAEARADAPGPEPAPGEASPDAVRSAAPRNTPRSTPATPRARHWGLVASFLLLVLAPFLVATTYLYTRAADQYHSSTAFSIRSEEAGSAAAGLLGAITRIGGGSASDTDILYNFIRSQEIVERVDAALDLRTLYNRPEGDPWFALGENAAIEDLVAHWGRMVRVEFAPGEGIIEVRANAFAPDDAQAIARAILNESSRLVNRLSEQAREDAVRFAREELAEAEETLSRVRQELAEFRRANRIVDPSADVAGQMGLLNALQSELAQALVERDMLLSFVGESDQRVVQANRRITAVTARIEEERASLGVSGMTAELPEIVGRYEELLVDLEFASTAYTQALAGLSAARAEARRQSRYLAPHVEPTRAEAALYPRRAMLAGLTGLFLMIGWGIAVLVYYNVRDNR